MKKYLDKDALAYFAQKLTTKQKEIFATKNEVGAPLVAQHLADMTDTSKIYVYIGGETGMTYGNWYYWNDNHEEWRSGGIYNSAAVATDETLTEPGMPADAKAVGDKFAEVDEELAEKANVDGVYSGMAVGYADQAGAIKTDQGANLVCGTNDQPFGLRPTAFPFDESVISVGNKVTVNESRAFSFVKNNQIANGNFASTSNWNGVGGIFSVSNNIGTLTVSTPAAYFQNRVRQTISTVVGHKYLLSAIIRSSSAVKCGIACGGETVLVTPTANVWTTVQGIITIDSTASLEAQLGYEGTPSVGDTLDVRDYFIIDLTQWFNNDTAILNSAHLTVAWFLNNFGRYIPTEQNLGELVNTWATKIKTTGVNLWDEEWETGQYNPSTGEPMPSQSAIRSKNKIRVIPSRQYYSNIVQGVSFRMLFYDDKNNFVGTSTNHLFTVPSNAVWMNFHTSDGYGSVYNHDIQICNHWTETDIEETYHPNEEWLFGLDWSFVGEGNTPHGINSKVGDYKDYKNGKNGVVVGRVDLGTLNWGYRTDTPRPMFSSQRITDLGGNYNIICSKYNYPSGSYDRTNWYYTPYGQIRVRVEDQAVYIADSNYTTVAAFKAAMSGVILQYELANPVITDMPEAERLNNSYDCNDYGNEQIFNGDEESVGCFDLLYQKNLVRQIFNNEDAIADHETRIETLEAELPALPTTDGTYTLKVVVTSGTPTVDWVLDA